MATVEICAEKCSLILFENVYLCLTGTRLMLVEAQGFMGNDLLSVGVG